MPNDYYTMLYTGEEIDALLASAGVPIGITKEYDSVSAMNDDFSSTDVTRGQFVLILPTDTSSEDYGKVYLKGSANWVYVFTLTSLTAIKGPQGPAGKRGAKGADGADGKNFMVLGYYETLSALNAAVPSPEDGDTYGIGTEPPYAYYMYDPTISTWRYVGNLQGPAGSQGEKGDKGDKGDTGATGPQGPEGPVGGSSNFVRYDAAQTLTDAQKQQARRNIAAAPDGFGLGGSAALLTPADNLDTLMKNGWFQYNSNNPPKGTLPTALSPYASTIHVSVAGNTCVQEAYDVSDSAFQGTVLRRTVYGLGAGAKIYPWEYENPPMQLGIEYRTTERYLSKPVYAKLIDCGNLPAPGSTKNVSHGVSGCLPIMVTAQMSNSNTIPWLGKFTVGADNTNIVLYSPADGSDFSGLTAMAILKYIKTTD
jgi:hypothetical protein